MRLSRKWALLLKKRAIRVRYWKVFSFFSVNSNPWLFTSMQMHDFEVEITDQNNRITTKIFQFLRLYALSELQALTLGKVIGDNINFVEVIKNFYSIKCIEIMWLRPPCPQLLHFIEMYSRQNSSLQLGGGGL